MYYNDLKSVIGKIIHKIFNITLANYIPNNCVLNEAL